MPNSIIEAQITLAEEEAKLAWCNQFRDLPFAGMYFGPMKRIDMNGSFREINMIYSQPLAIPKIKSQWYIRHIKPKTIKSRLKEVWYKIRRFLGIKTNMEKWLDIVKFRYLDTI